MTTTYTLIAKQTVGSGGASSVTFSSIPNTFTDLKLVMSGRDDSSSNNWNLVKIQFNTDTTSGNYTYKLVGGFGSTAYSASGNQLASYLTSNARTANTFGNNEIYIPNYAGSTAKSFSSDSVTEGNGSSYEIMGLWAGLWSGTSAINQIVLSPDAGNFAEFSTFYLYGISNGSTQLAGAYATGGDVIVNDGTYWYHAFKYSGTFTPLKGLSCDYLVVAGGGGGADMIAGGGGAGGLRSTLTNTGGGASLESALSFAGNTSYTVTIGSGGIGAASNTNSSGTSGNNSSIIGGSISLVSIGGGYGSPSGINGGNGGSGGGTRGGGVAVQSHCG